jgi:hypothetical protein
METKFKLDKRNKDNLTTEEELTTEEPTDQDKD